MTKEQENQIVDDFIKKKLDEAKLIIAQGRELRPEITFITYYPAEERAGSLPLPSAHVLFETELTKSLVRGYIQKSADLIIVASDLVDHKYGIHFDYELVAVVTMFTAYISTQKIDKEDPNKKRLRASEDPNRREGLIFMNSFPNRDSSYTYEYENVGGVIIFDDVRIIDDSNGKLGGRFSELYPQLGKKKDK